MSSGERRKRLSWEVTASSPTVGFRDECRGECRSDKKKKKKRRRKKEKGRRSANNRGGNGQGDSDGGVAAMVKENFNLSQQLRDGGRDREDIPTKT